MFRSRNAGWLVPLLLTVSVAIAAPRMTSKSKKSAAKDKDSEAATSDSSAPAKDAAASADGQDADKDKADKNKKVIKTEAEWRRLLTRQQFEVTRHKETEGAFTGKYARSKKDGIYHCVCCGQPLFDSRAKYESGTGWPSYYEAIEKEALQELPDTSEGVFRTEVECSRCDAHLGHVFPDGPEPTGLRYCINSASLKFEPRGGKPDPAHDKKSRTKSKPAKGKAKTDKAKEMEEVDSKSAE